MLTKEQIKKSITDASKKHGVSRVYLFGSYARGDATENSDIDLRIDEGNIKDLYDLASFYLEIKNNLNKEVDILTTDSLKPSFLEAIKNEEILLYAA